MAGQAKGGGRLSLPVAFHTTIAPAVQNDYLFAHDFIKAKTRPESERVSKCY
jgi:hypothetical protein